LGLVTLVYIVFQARVAITLTIGAALLAVALNHAVDALRKRGLRRALAIAVVILAMLAIFCGIAILVIPPAVTQGKALVEQGPLLLEKFRHTQAYQTLDERLHIDESIAGVVGQNLGSFKGAVESSLTIIGSVVALLFAGLTIFFLTVFMLIFGGKLVRSVLDDVGPPTQVRYERVLKKLYDSIGGYLAGVVLIGSVNAICTTTFLALTHIPFFLPLGILSGVASLIPYVGTATMAILVSLISLVTGGVPHAVGTALYFIIYGQFEGQVLSPLVYRRTINVNPLVALLSTLFFVNLAGIPGAVVAVPAAAAAQIIIREMSVARREKPKAE
jgi:predicted PurR-regulated permease PerM